MGTSWGGTFSGGNFSGILLLNCLVLILCLHIFLYLIVSNAVPLMLCLVNILHYKAHTSISELHFCPTALKGCRGIVFTPGVWAGGWKKFVRAVSQKP